MSARRQLPILLLGALLLACAFFAYLRPGFVIDLSNLLWLCS